MNRFKGRGGIAVIGLLVLAVGLTGCATPTAKPEPAPPAVSWKVADTGNVPQGLREAVLKFWEHRYQRDWDACYQMETPDNRAAIERDWYVAYYRGGWTVHKAVVTRIEMKAGDEAISYADAVVKDPRDDKPRTLVLGDKWKQVGDTWYHFFDDPLLRLRIMKGPSRRPKDTEK